jgi:hypothetical protein
MHLIDDIEKAWIGGYSAYHKHKNITENPYIYEYESDYFFEWRNGWLAAEDIEFSVLEWGNKYV